MKQQIAQNIERNLAQAKEMQKVGQRVQQGDPDYLRDGETRDGKIAELTQKLAQLKKQHQQLLQQQSDPGGGARAGGGRKMSQTRQGRHW